MKVTEHFVSETARIGAKTDRKTARVGDSRISNLPSSALWVFYSANLHDTHKWFDANDIIIVQREKTHDKFKSY